MFESIFRKKNTKVIYTALFGDIDAIKKPVSVIPETDYLLYTDKKRRIKNWKQSIHTCDQNPRRCAKRFKIIFDPTYEYSIYCDASFEIHMNSWEEVLDSVSGNKEFALTINPERECLYDEGEVCIERARDAKEVIEKQLQRYRVMMGCLKNMAYGPEVSSYGGIRHKLSSYVISGGKRYRMVV